MGNETDRLARSAERKRQALELRRAGLTYDEIAATEFEGKPMYASKGAAHTAVKNALKAIPKEAAEDLYALQMARYEDLLAGIYGVARDGDQFAIDRAVKIMDAMNRLANLHEREPDDNTQAVVAVFKQFGKALNQRFEGDTYGRPEGEEAHGTGDGLPALDDRPGREAS